MATERLFVTTDTAALEQSPKRSADAILANVKTSMLLKARQPLAEDEFWGAVGEREVRQFTHACNVLACPTKDRKPR